MCKEQHAVDDNVSFALKVCRVHTTAAISGSIKMDTDLPTGEQVHGISAILLMEDH
jgi:hypothetical protein